MGSIFGIADLPVSTIDKAVSIESEMAVPVPVQTTIPKSEIPEVALERTPINETFISSSRKHHFSNPFIKMRNGFGRLMNHFQRPLIK